jgi:hypothetical protein
MWEAAFNLPKYHMLHTHIERASSQPLVACEGHVTIYIVVTIPGCSCNLCKLSKMPLHSR